MSTDMTMAEVRDAIETFADNEPVDPLQLKRALADEAGREHLIDLLVMRRFAKGSVVSRAEASQNGRPEGRPPRTLDQDGRARTQGKDGRDGRHEASQNGRPEGRPLRTRGHDGRKRTWGEDSHFVEADPQVGRSDGRHDFVE